jgi:hypothetical protein
MARKRLLLGLLGLAGVIGLCWWYSPVPKGYGGLIDSIDAFVPLPLKDWHWLDPLNSIQVPIFRVACECHPVSGIAILACPSP